jgi:hypothetical protein
VERSVPTREVSLTDSHSSFRVMLSSWTAEVDVESDVKTEENAADEEYL